MHCKHNIPETKKGVGPCNIRYEVKKRNGKPNWWCRAHGLEASAPDGTPLAQCSGAWFDAVSEDMQIDVDLSTGELAVWGVVPPAIKIGRIPNEPGKVHVHHRREAGGVKDIDRSFDIVRVHKDGNTEVIEGMAAQAFAISVLAQTQVQPLKCTHCGEIHIDELVFATFPHVKHLCNGCGRNFWNRPASVSNPLSDIPIRLGLPVPSVQQINRPLEIASSDYTGVAIWPSNRAIVNTMSRPGDMGLHVHAWSDAGTLKIDETYSPVILDGEVLDEQLVRILAIQRFLADHLANNAAHKIPIISLACIECGHSISPAPGDFEPPTRHTCDACGAETRTRRRSFLNPLADK